MISQKNKLFLGALSVYLTSFALLSTAHSSANGTWSCPQSLTGQEVQNFVNSPAYQASYAGGVSCHLQNATQGLTNNLNAYGANDVFSPEVPGGMLANENECRCTYKAPHMISGIAEITIRCTR